MIKLILLSTIVIVGLGCAGKRSAIDNYVDDQRDKIITKVTRIDGELDFSISAMEVNLEEIDTFRGAWLEYSHAVPESKDLKKIIETVEDPKNRVVLVSLFRSSYEEADLTSKPQGWTVFPVPANIIELSEYDVPVRTLMPIDNAWARYFMLVYRSETWLASPKLIIGNKHNKVEIKPE